MSSSRLSYATHPDTPAEAELSVLANVYRFALDCRARKEATRPGSPDDAKEIRNDARHQHRNT